MPKGVWDHSKYRGNGNPKYRHGQSVGGHSHIYMVWADMKRRATNTKHHQAKNYVSRGIGVCKEWLSAENFLRWALSHGYKKGLTLDRENNERGYSPDNCRFVPGIVNLRNSRVAKINVDTARKIKALLHLRSFTHLQIADAAKCSKGIVDSIARGGTWKDA